MRKSSKGSKASVKVEQPPGEKESGRCYVISQESNQVGASPLHSFLSLAAEGVDDVKVKAVNEMMERIKHGVVLRPVKSQESKVRTSQADGTMPELPCSGLQAVTSSHSVKSLH